MLCSIISSRADAELMLGGGPRCVRLHGRHVYDTFSKRKYSNKQRLLTTHCTVLYARERNISYLSYLNVTVTNGIERYVVKYIIHMHPNISITILRLYSFAFIGNFII